MSNTVSCVHAGYDWPGRAVRPPGLRMLCSGSHGRKGCGAPAWQRASCRGQYDLSAGCESGLGLFCVAGSAKHFCSGGVRASSCKFVVSSLLLDSFAAAARLHNVVRGVRSAHQGCAVFLCNKEPV